MQGPSNDVLIPKVGPQEVSQPAVFRNRKVFYLFIFSSNILLSIYNLIHSAILCYFAIHEYTHSATTRLIEKFFIVALQFLPAMVRDYIRCLVIGFHYISVFGCFWIISERRVWRFQSSLSVYIEKSPAKINSALF